MAELKEPKARVLAVDDEPDITESIKKVLSESGYEVKEASSGEEALDYLRANPCDLMILDIKMPGMSGLDVITEAKKLKPATKIMVVTGYRGDATAKMALKRGAVHSLTKPIVPDVLVESVERILEK